MANFILDGHKLNHHPQAVADAMKGRVIFPIYAEISPVANCNHHCLFCHYNYLGHKGFFRRGRMRGLVEEFAGVGIKSLVFAGIGEPLLHPETVSTIAYAKESGIDVAMSTNGALLRESDVDILANSLMWIRFSFNGGNAANYGKIHRTKANDYGIVLENIRRLKSAKVRLKAPITIGIQYILLPQNKNFVVDVARLMKDVGVDYFVVKHFYSHGKNDFIVGSDWPDEGLLRSLRDAASNISDDKFSFILRDHKNVSGRRNYNKCYGLPFIVYVREDGEVYNCFSYQHDKNTSLGNIFKKTFRQVWLSQKKIAEYINSKIDKDKCQPNCRHHQINQYLWELRNPSIEHVNFI